VISGPSGPPPPPCRVAPGLVLLERRGRHRAYFASDLTEVWPLLAISTALRTARHGFALSGGNALIAHGIVSRLTQDVDLFTDREAGVAAAADAVEWK
jgi:hypothetical protein